MKDDVRGYAIGFLNGFLIGTVLIGFAIKHMNIDFDYAISDRYKASVEICKSVDNTPVSMKKELKELSEEES